MTDCSILKSSEVQEAFLSAPPTIAQTIYDLTLTHPSFLRDIPSLELWPTGMGTVMQQLIFRGSMPQIERGFEKWSKLQNNTGCEACDGPDCHYNWTTFGGTSLSRRATELMRREFRSQEYCISEIQTTAHFKEVFAKIVENLYRQVDFFKEMNIVQNYLTALAKKYVVDSAGAKANPQNPYVYRAPGTAKLACLNIDMLEFFYEQMRRIPDVVPYDVVNGSPVFALMASHQTIARMYRDDPNLRQDVRFSGYATAQLEKYNFMSTIRGMFIAAPVLYPRRFNIVNADWVEVLPFVNGLPGEVGTYTGLNPAYEDATHEEVMLFGKFPFKLFYMPTEQSLGANTSFGPEYSYFNSWSWVNPMTVQDPFRRVGFFATGAAIGLSQQFSEGIIGIMVERQNKRVMAHFNPEPECPAEPVTCDNEVPAVACPCPLVESVVPHPITSGRYFVTFAADPGADQGDTIQLALEGGGYVTGTVVSESSDGLTLELSISADLTACRGITAVFCDDTLGCSANVLKVVDCGSLPGRYTLILSNPIKADTAMDEFTGYCADGSAVTLTVLSVDLLTNTWVVSADAECNCGGIVTVCVPPETDATCPACGGPVVTQCS